jgi:hypothetical protein
MMQTQTDYSGAIARNIPAEMAEIAREMGEGMTRIDLRNAGYTDAQIDKHAHDASVLFAKARNRRAA